MKQVKIWLQKDIYGKYYFNGSYFFKKEIGDIPASTPYEKKELQLKVQLNKLKKKPFKKLYATCETLATDYGFKPNIERCY